jgi:hypothetical protein
LDISLFDNRDINSAPDEMHDGGKIYFEVTTVELICRKDTSKLLEATILSRLTTGLKIISTQPLHLYSNDDDLLVRG